MAPEWVSALAAVLAVVVSVFALTTSLGRAKQKTIDDNNSALQTQVRALELDIAGNYPKRAQVDSEIDKLGTRLENSIKDLAGQIADLRRAVLSRVPP